ncbi:MAG: hypothetical protein V7765_17580 [Oleispira sp.]
MKTSQYLAIAVRLFSIMLFITGLRQLLPLIELITSGSVNGMGVSLIFAIPMALIPILFSFVLWFFPVSVSALIIRPEMDQNVVPLTQGSWLVIMIISLGLGTLYYAVGDAIAWLYFWHMSINSSFDDENIVLRAGDKANMFITLLELIASLFLIIKAKTVSRYLLKVTS